MAEHESSVCPCFVLQKHFESSRPRDKPKVRGSVCGLWDSLQIERRQQVQSFIVVFAKLAGHSPAIFVLNTQTAEQAIRI